MLDDAKKFLERSRTTNDLIAREEYETAIMLAIEYAETLETLTKGFVKREVRVSEIIDDNRTLDVGVVTDVLGLANHIQQKGIEPLAKYIAELELSERAAVQRMDDAEEAMIRMMDARQADDQRFSDLQDNYKDALDHIRKLAVVAEAARVYKEIRRKTGSRSSIRARMKLWDVLTDLEDGK